MSKRDNYTFDLLEKFILRCNDLNEKKHGSCKIVDVKVEINGVVFDLSFEG